MVTIYAYLCTEIEHRCADGQDQEAVVFNDQNPGPWETWEHDWPEPSCRGYRGLNVVDPEATDERCGQ